MSATEANAKYSNRVVSIFISPDKDSPMQELDSVQAMAGRGLLGDRYESRTGIYSGTKRISDLDRQVTLISLRAVMEANQELESLGIRPFTPPYTRRNVVLDIDPNYLNSQVSRGFFIGEIDMEGVELCDPCRVPAKLAERLLEDGKAFEIAFRKRGGLRARILTTGWIRRGDLFIPH